MKNYIVTYTLPQRHVVSVGVEGTSEADAIARAEAAFDAGTIWDDTPAMPLVSDDFEEDEASGAALEFTAELADAENPFQPDASVLQWRRDALARSACLALIAAYKVGAECGSVEWSDIDDAHALAVKALS